MTTVEQYYEQIYENLTENPKNVSLEELVLFTNNVGYLPIGSIVTIMRLYSRRANRGEQLDSIFKRFIKFYEDELWPTIITEIEKYDYVELYYILLEVNLTDYALNKIRTIFVKRYLEKLGSHSLLYIDVGWVEDIWGDAEFIWKVGMYYQINSEYPVISIPSQLFAIMFMPMNMFIGCIEQIVSDYDSLIHVITAKHLPCRENVQKYKWLFANIPVDIITRLLEFGDIPPWSREFLHPDYIIWLSAECRYCYPYTKHRAVEIYRNILRGNLKKRLKAYSDWSLAERKELWPQVWIIIHEKLQSMKVDDGIGEEN